MLLSENFLDAFREAITAQDALDKCEDSFSCRPHSQRLEAAMSNLQKEFTRAVREVVEDMQVMDDGK